VNILSIIATLGELAAVINDGGVGQNPVDTINAFAESAKGQRIIALFDQLLAEAGIKIVIAIRK
jgi:hypothetical protein